MGAYHNALREEGTRDDLLIALETAWAENEILRTRLVMIMDDAQNTLLETGPELSSQSTETDHG